jgi:hypothetical protein
MLRSLKKVFGYHLREADGGIGDIKDFSFDDDYEIAVFVV